MEKVLNKQRLMAQKKEEFLKKIRDLGSLPGEAFEKYQSTNVKKLYELLAKCNGKLKKYRFRRSFQFSRHALTRSRCSHVNKKALDQYVSFSEQRQELVERKSKQDQADTSIQDLIKVPY